MNAFARFAFVAATMVVAAGGLYLIGGVGGPSATPAATATPAPTSSVVQAGTITLTDDGCTWAGNPSPITATDGQVVVRFSVRNETDTFGNFGIFRLDSGTWDEAAAWILDENELLHGGPTHRPQDFATEVGGVDAPERREYPSGQVLAPGTYGIVCSSNEPPPGEVFAVYLVGPLEVEGP